MFLLVRKTDIKEEFRPMIGKLFEIYLKMMSEVDSEELVSSLEQIVSIFSDSIEPFALELCQNLEQSYWRLINIEDDDDNFGESSMAALT